MPKEVYVAGHVLEVRPYTNKPRQCSRCWKFGHPAKYCKNEFKYCQKCGQSKHELSECNSTITQCVNCGEKHHTTAKSCPHFVFNNKVFQFQQKRGFPRRAAIQHLKRTGEINTVTYASRLKINNIASAQMNSSSTLSSQTPMMNNINRKASQKEKETNISVVSSANLFQFLEDECSGVMEEDVQTDLESPHVNPKRRLPVSPTANENHAKKRLYKHNLPQKSPEELLIDFSNTNNGKQMQSPGIPSRMK